MKTLNIILGSIAILAFSGCYTQLLIEDDPPMPVNAKPIVTHPLPPVTDPDVVVVAPPGPIYVPIPVPVPPPVYVPPAYSNPVTLPAAEVPVHRTSGAQRSGSEAFQASSQNTTRNSGVTRSGGR